MISSKTFYAIAAMVHIAKRSGQSPVSLSAIAWELDISTSYVEQIFNQLRRRGLVEGIRGPGGGYRIAKPSLQISIADIVYAFEVFPKHSDSITSHQALSSLLWDEVSARLYQFLSTITLATYAQELNRASLIPHNCISYKIANMFPAHQATAPEARAG